ncbi:hypothetical protein ACFQ1E_07820 [Sphingomonas canadensis]|uniref:Uncharacterized protein n=1 Tax=Sphingomonas canadensis TaxID=1219257 RepID=A0ABW3H4D1_9SPHN|nr:hypothetical protein [Sphingomonas canadensis]MCW3835943.1 hypothetical protein [Sphingomonas canadensis]
MIARHAIRAAIAAAALCASGSASAQLVNGDFRFLTENDDNVVMVGTTVAGPDTARRFDVVLVLRSAAPSGSDSFAFVFVADCVKGTYRYSYTEAYSGNTLLSSGPSEMEAKPPAAGTLNDAAHKYGCEGKSSGGDSKIVKGMGAARMYGRSLLN